MRRFSLSVLFLGWAISGFAQGVSETDKLASLCRIWGMLKYFHPAVAQGKMDWDAVFISEVDSLAHIITKDALNTHYYRWVSSLGDINAYLAVPAGFDTTCNFNHSLEWIDRSGLYSPQLAALLRNVVIH